MSIRMLYDVGCISSHPAPSTPRIGPINNNQQSQQQHKNLTKTATELRMLLSDIDQDKNRKVNFLEWCCFAFQKPWEELNNFVDEVCALYYAQHSAAQYSAAHFLHACACHIRDICISVSAHDS